MHCEISGNIKIICIPQPKIITLNGTFYLCEWFNDKVYLNDKGQD
jgi:hypothetical protein